MQFRGFAFYAGSVAVMLLAITSIASASPFSAIIVYGDSLSDNGNLFAHIGYPPAPYYNGRFSNGPVAVEQLASRLGAPLYDFAFGGATSGLGNYLDGGSQTTFGALGAPGMMAELAGSAAILSSPITPSSLFVVWGGANDFLTGGSAASGVADIDAIVIQLQSAGAKHILVPGMPDLGLTPDFLGFGAATAYSQQFNTTLKASLPSRAIYVDTFGLMRLIENNPSAYGITNVTDPCFNGTSVCSNPNEYLFWDGFHPTTAADKILAEKFEASVTPEPATFLLMATGMVGLMILFRRQLPA